MVKSVHKTAHSFSKQFNNSPTCTESINIYPVIPGGADVPVIVLKVTDDPSTDPDALEPLAVRIIKIFYWSLSETEWEHIPQTKNGLITRAWYVTHNDFAWVTDKNTPGVFNIELAYISIDIQKYYITPPLKFNTNGYGTLHDAC